MKTINLALHEYAARHRRIAALDHYAAAAQAWDYEGRKKMRSASMLPPRAAIPGRLVPVALYVTRMYGPGGPNVTSDHAIGPRAGDPPQPVSPRRNRPHPTPRPRPDP